MALDPETRGEPIQAVRQLVNDALVEALLEKEIDVLVVAPFVSGHEGTKTTTGKWIGSSKAGAKSLRRPIAP